LWRPSSGLSNPNIPNPIATYTLNTSYTVIVTDANGCQDSDTELLSVFTLPEADFTIRFYGSDSTLYADEELNLTNLSNPKPASYQWTFGDGASDTIFEPIHKYTTEGTYEVVLILITPEGCRDTARYPLRYSITPKIYVPTAFSPNGDGINDFFNIAYLNLKNFNAMIFDRWGNKLFQTQDPSFRWDGTVKGNPLPEGVYTIYLKGIGARDEVIEYSGTITLFR
jgi:gliding motility-associated-like protein